MNLKISPFFICLLFLTIISSLFLFARIDLWPMEMWDESRLAVNALEMSINRNFIVTFFNGAPDMWNTKPPLMIWSIVLSMNIFGFNELGLRFPSALCGLLTIIFLFYFIFKQTRNPGIGLWAGLILLTSTGYITYHGTRTGDYDSMLVLFTTIYGLMFFQYLNSENKKSRYLLYFFAAIILAVMTKGVAGFMLLPGLFLYMLVEKKTKMVFTDRNTYLYSLIFLVTVGSYFLLREYYNPGYLKAVNENDIFGRYTTTLSGHHHPFSYYIDNIYNSKYISWIYFLPFAMAAGLCSKSSIKRKITLYSVVMGVTYLLIISLANTKLYWYEMPVYPFFAIIISIGLSELIEIFINQEKERKMLPWVFFLFVSCLLFLLPLYNLINSGIYEYNAKINYRIVFANLVTKNPEIKRVLVPNEDYNAVLSFYSQVYNLKGYNFQVTGLRSDFKEGDVLFLASAADIQAIDKMYETYIITYFEKYPLCKVLNKKEIAYSEVLLQNVLADIKNSPGWLNSIKTKATNNKISLNEQLLGDAVYFLKEQNKISEQEGIELIKKYKNHMPL